MTEPRSRRDDDESIDLLLGLLPEAERRDVLARLAADPDAESEFRARAARLEAARARRAASRPAAKGRAKILRFVWAPVVLAAAVLAGILLPGTEPNLLAPLPTDGEVLNLRSEEAAVSGLEEALALYRDERWTEAAKRLRSSDVAEGPLRDLYLASALAFSGEPEAALIRMKDLPFDALPEPWRSEAKWTRAICLLEVGREAEARAAIRKLSADGEPEIARRAVKWLER